MSRLRCAVVLAMLLVPCWLRGEGVLAEEAATILPHLQSPATMELSLRRLNTDLFDWAAVSKWASVSRLDLPRVPRMTRSHQPLRQVELFGGDRFLAECLNWGSEQATFRLLNGQSVRVPIAAIASLSSPPGEVDLIDESFEAGSPVERDDAHVRQLDESTAADGRRSLRLDEGAAGYMQRFDPPLNFARIQFWFRVQCNDEASKCGEWILRFGDQDTSLNAIVVRIESDRQMTVSGIAPGNDRTLQSLKVSDGWHLFTALILPERTRLIVDEYVLATFACPKRPFHGIDFRSTASKNAMWIDEFQVRKLIPIKDGDRSRNRPIDSDTVWTADGDEVFVRLHQVSRLDVVVESFDRRQALPWNRIRGLVCQQPAQPIAQLSRMSFGAVVRIEGQSFADRPDCASDQWYVTIRHADSKQLFVQHPLIGEMRFQWSEVRRIEPLFYGESLLIDARQFHLGNSIRMDLARQQPDGTEFRGQFDLQHIPVGQPYFSLKVAELEAGGPDAPIATPFLADLRAGRLVTEVLINDQRVGDLNSLIRFKSPSQSPQRLRLAVPRDLLHGGVNSFVIRQHPLKVREYDDGELGNIHLEFDLDHAR